MSSKTIEWTRQSTSALIEEYEKHPCLYNTKSEEYFHRKKKRNALETITKKMKKIIPNITDEDCKKKCHVLRTQFGREHSKHMLSLKNGMASDEVYTPTWWYYSQLIFLKDSVEHKKNHHVGLRSDVKKEEEDEADMHVEYLEENESLVQAFRKSTTSSPEPGPSVRQRRRTMSENLISTPPSISKSSSPRQLEKPQSPVGQGKLNNVVINFYGQTNTRDPLKIFGEFVESRLRDITNKKNRRKAEHEILKILTTHENMEDEFK